MEEHETDAGRAGNAPAARRIHVTFRDKEIPGAVFIDREVLPPRPGSPGGTNQAERSRREPLVQDHILDVWCLADEPPLEIAYYLTGPLRVDAPAGTRWVDPRRPTCALVVPRSERLSIVWREAAFTGASSIRYGDILYLIYGFTTVADAT